jgi:hypothetical protein
MHNVFTVDSLRIVEVIGIGRHLGFSVACLNVRGMQFPPRLEFVTETTEEVRGMGYPSTEQLVYIPQVALGFVWRETPETCG